MNLSRPEPSPKFEKVRDNIKDLLDDFVNDYLSVNPK